MFSHAVPAWCCTAWKPKGLLRKCPWCAEGCCVICTWDSTEGYLTPGLAAIGAQNQHWMCFWTIAAHWFLGTELMYRMGAKLLKWLPVTNFFSVTTFWFLLFFSDQGKPAPSTLAIYVAAGNLIVQWIPGARNAVPAWRFLLWIQPLVRCSGAGDHNARAQKDLWNWLFWWTWFKMQD